MKQLFFSVSSLSFIIFLLLLGGCKKSNPTPPSPSVPVVTTTPVSNQTATSFQSGGSITEDGGSAVTARGICWDINDPTIAGSKTSDGSGTGAFTSTATNLKANTTYSVRAYATNSSGTGYGPVITVLTQKGVPAVKTDYVNENVHKWYGGGTVINTGGADIIERGICWATHANPTVADIRTIDPLPTTDPYSFKTRIALSINATYYIRAYATNSYGTGYGNELKITTTVAIGLYYGGGVIFSVDNTGQHGRIAALVDQSTNCPWAKSSFFTTFVNAGSATDGAANTNQIIAVQGNSGVYAAKLCRDYRAGGFTDWYLPAYQEMWELSTVGIQLELFPSHDFLNENWYWTSTENNYFRAYKNDNFYGAANPQKDELNKVRAIRAF